MQTRSEVFVVGDFRAELRAEICAGWVLWVLAVVVLMRSLFRPRR